jgi:hypothetical protein
MWQPHKHATSFNGDTSSNLEVKISGESNVWIYKNWEPKLWE